MNIFTKCFSVIFQNSRLKISYGPIIDTEFGIMTASINYKRGKLNLKLYLNIFERFSIIFLSQ